MTAVLEAMLQTPRWPAPANVRALMTTRSGGVSKAPYDTLNLGTHVGDAAQDVARNRALLRAHLPAEPVWMQQVHGIEVVDAAARTGRSVADGPSAIVPTADAAFTQSPNVVCAVMTADCLPVLFAEESGAAVGIAHAGWRGLSSGVIEATLAAMRTPSSRLLAYLGPAIGANAYEVGTDVRAAFVAVDAHAAMAFRAKENGKYWCDLYRLARQRLERAGVQRIYGGDACTFAERDRYFSFRRDGVTGRMASLIWIAA